MARQHDDVAFLDVLYRVCDALCEGERREFTRDNGITRFTRGQDDAILVEGAFVAVSLEVPSVRVSLSGITDPEGNPLEFDKDAIAGLSGRLINLDYEQVKDKVLPG
ncbi:MAG: hypothetical protein VBE63_02850 [Lamprobacter sp.]|uniref:hypothetical protein n=1 Tax=Lamprobacter sp. TaxID=3100796 RepID=UPI002B256DAF|nr:hypothetical protein [Lamprobacter sp.]MEA3638864.1 hypothetical protein [Lamprobacter sp.]